MIRNIIASFPKLIKRIIKDDVFGVASQFAYFFLLSIFPLLIFSVTLLSYLPFSLEDYIGFLRDFVPEESMRLIEYNLNTIISQQNGKLLSFGIIATIWSASNGIDAIVRTFNNAYEVEETRSFIVAKGMGILFTLAMIFVIIIALLLPVFGREVGVLVFSVFGLSEEFLTIWNMIRWLVSSLILLIMFVFLYWLGPNKKIKCLSVLPGALFSTIGWILASFAFAYYVSNFGNYSATYGSIGAIIVLMIWFYITGVIILLGGEINAFSSRLKDESCK